MPPTRSSGYSAHQLGSDGDEAAMSEWSEPTMDTAAFAVMPEPSVSEVQA